ncbi:transglycosylase domain-containing protein [Salipaludibacillus sp. CF4.18]|uniref:transglycosylase domain-containing protein n=1 Tax=Salipaludibacillus sp. CF4.18 TaxID=3373081 RepID=UPI003EE764B8
MELATRKSYMKRRRLIRKFVWGCVLSVFGGFMALSALVIYAYQMEAPSLSVPETTVVYDANGATIGEYHKGEQRYWVPIDHMSESIVEATLAIEDRRFYDHYGFDPIRITRAVIANLQTGTKGQGASTITQQYARNLFLTHDKTWMRKWQEALYALRLELHYSKKEILEGYLNTIYYGHGAYGVEAASLLYFQKNAENLSYSEAALLAGIPKGPSVYSPYLNEDMSIERQHVVLNAMDDAEYISDSQATKFENEVISFSKDMEIHGNRIAPYFQDAVRMWLIEDLGMEESMIDGGGLDIYTTLDSSMQEKADAIVAEEMAPDHALETAFVAMDPRTGKVKALVGGKNYKESSFNRATQARRHPGSAMKPFLYYAALEHGLSPNSMLKSEETTFVFDEGREEYSPSNFNHSYANDYITMLQALAISDNIYAMKTHFLLGFEDLIHTAKRFGIESPLKPAPSLALGSVDLGVLEITKSYSPLANGGYVVNPQFVEKVIDRDENVLYEANEEPVLELNPAYTAVMTNMMEGMFEPELSTSYGAVTGGSISESFDRPVAGKSGSTDKDSWMIGYAPQLLTGVWVGYDEAIPLESGDAKHSKQIWAKFMKESLDGELKLTFPIPENVVEVEINPFNGLLANEHCPLTRKTLFFHGTEPTEYCQAPEQGLDETELEETDDKMDEEYKKDEEEKKEKWLDRIFDWSS